MTVYDFLTFWAFSYTFIYIHIHSAKITTFGEKVEDVFTVSNAENLALNDDEQQKLTAILCEDNK